MASVTTRDIASATGLGLRSVQRKLQELKPVDYKGNVPLYGFRDVFRLFLPTKNEENISQKLKEANLQYVLEKTTDQKIKNDIALNTVHSSEDCLNLRNQTYSRMKDILEKMPYRISSIPATQKNIRLQEARKLVLEVLTELNKLVY